MSSMVLTGTLRVNNLHAWLRISADDILNYFSYIFPENKSQHFMQIALFFFFKKSLHEMPNSVFPRKKKENALYTLCILTDRPEQIV